MFNLHKPLSIMTGIKNTKDIIDPYKEFKRVLETESNEKLTFMKNDHFFQDITKLHFEWISGYKIVDKDLKGYNDFQYEVNKKYSINEIPVLCNKGFHFCLKPEDCFSYYEFYNNNRLFKVKSFVLFDDKKICSYHPSTRCFELYPEIQSFPYRLSYSDKICASKIILTEEINKNDLLKIVNEKYPSIDKVDYLGYNNIDDIWKDILYRKLTECGYSKLFIRMYCDNIKRKIESSITFSDNIFLKISNILMILDSNMEHDLQTYTLLKYIGM